jgi:hypothetical protein
MVLDPEQAPAKLDGEEGVVYFCLRGCRAQYEEEAPLASGSAG